MHLLNHLHYDIYLPISILFCKEVSPPLLMLLCGPYLKSKGIQQFSSSPSHPSSNGEQNRLYRKFKQQVVYLIDCLDFCLHTGTPQIELLDQLMFGRPLCSRLAFI